MSERRCVYRAVVGKPEGETTRRRWEANIKTDLQDMRWEGIDWIDLA